MSHLSIFRPNKQCTTYAQLEECHIRIHDLEQSLEQVESQKDELLQEKNKLCWEHQKRQKVT